ncbi:nad dependent epimerase [Diplodia corticola]|uniref:Nad dependent epimerase n=1 Tax=Diplodia corticola TaxID=236234 RepID=A0A1J9RMG6_9PEZI|nr:nad dependent epimerase [Diplodia corticola]OJD33771.1 nad dependent epimerase [Diplodia corticola]
MAYASKYTRKPRTDVFTHDTDIDRRNCKRTVPMRVICLGLGRTGTASLREALRQLGLGECYHMMSTSVENPPDALMWMDALSHKYDGVGEFGRKQWDQLLGHCQSVCDWPAAAFVEELTEAYPDAKVIITTRDVDSWYKSCLKTVDWRANDVVLGALARCDWASGLYQPMLSKFWTDFFKGDFKQHGKQAFREHYEHVRAVVPPENLLEYHVGQGWKPLCDFLGLPLPPAGQDMVHTNDTEGFVDRCKARNRAQICNVALLWWQGSLPGQGHSLTVIGSMISIVPWPPNSIP